MKHTVTCLVKNQPGALADLTGAFFEKGINIYSLAVSEREESEVSRMTLVVEAEEHQLDEIDKVAGEVEAVKILSAMKSCPTATTCARPPSRLLPAASGSTATIFPSAASCRSRWHRAPSPARAATCRGTR